MVQPRVPECLGGLYSRIVFRLQITAHEAVGGALSATDCNGPVSVIVWIVVGPFHSVKMQQGC